jgi:hypothetical protein
MADECCGVGTVKIMRKDTFQDIPDTGYKISISLGASGYCNCLIAAVTYVQSIPRACRHPI